jgi:hypothetical protein
VPDLGAPITRKSGIGIGASGVWEDSMFRTISTIIVAYYRQY